MTAVNTTNARPVFREDHEQFREQVRRFVEREVLPHLPEWEKAGIVPRELWRKAGDNGLLCVTVPDSLAADSTLVVVTLSHALRL